MSESKIPQRKTRNQGARRGKNSKNELQERFGKNEGQWEDLKKEVETIEQEEKREWEEKLKKKLEEEMKKEWEEKLKKKEQEMKKEWEEKLNKERADRLKSEQELNKERAEVEMLKDTFWRQNWKTFGQTITTIANIRQFFEDYPLLDKECDISHLEEILKAFQPFKPLEEDYRSSTEYYRKAREAELFEKTELEKLRYSQIRNLLKLIIGNSCQLKIQTFDEKPRGNPTQAIGLQAFPESFIHSFKEQEWKSKKPEEKLEGAICTIEVKKLVGEELTPNERDPNEREETTPKANDKDKVTRQLITRCFQRNCPSRQEGSKHFPWVGLFFDHFRVGAVVIFHKDQVENTEFAKPVSEQFPICIVRTKTYFFAGDGKTEEDFEQAAKLIRMVVALGRRAFELRAMAEHRSLCGPDDRSGFYVPVGDKGANIPLKIQYLILNTNHHMGVVENPLGDKWIFKRDPPRFLWNFHAPTIAREAKILQHLGTFECPNIPSVKYFGPDHRGEEVLVTAPLGCAIQSYDLPLPVEQIQCIFSDILAALQSMHKHNIVHGDVSFNNIVWKDARCQNALLIDFGTSNFVSEVSWNSPRTPLTCSVGAMLGSPPKSIDDLESLLYVMEYLATGTLPWKEMPPEDQLEAKIRFLEKCNEPLSSLPSVVTVLPFMKISEEAHQAWNRKEEIQFQSTWHALESMG